jgi:hypothetical protein
MLVVISHNVPTEIAALVHAAATSIIMVHRQPVALSKI